MATSATVAFPQKWEVAAEEAGTPYQIETAKQLNRRTSDINRWLDQLEGRD